MCSQLGTAWPAPCKQLGMFRVPAVTRHSPGTLCISYLHLIPSANYMSSLSAWPQWAFLHGRGISLPSGLQAANHSTSIRGTIPLEQVRSYFFFPPKIPSASCKLFQTSLISHSTLDTPFSTLSFSPILRNYLLTQLETPPPLLLSSNAHSLSQQGPKLLFAWAFTLQERWSSGQSESTQSTKPQRATAVPQPAHCKRGFLVWGTELS